MEITKPLCSAPFNSLLIETDKSIAPCCAWKGKYLGNFESDNILNILQGERLKEIQTTLLNQEWPEECIGCKEREEVTGTSARLNQYASIPYNPNNSLTFLEFNSSNLCNLACIPCTPSWSSGWEKFRKLNNWPEQQDKNFHPVWKMYPGKTSSIEKFLNSVDLSSLEKIMLKGGEPFLNKENIVLLKHLVDTDRIKNIDVVITTNGTVVNEQMMELLRHARHVKLMVSMDGVGCLNEYIRHDVDGYFGSHTDDIISNLMKFLQLPSCHIAPIFSVQPANVFRLHEFTNWWQEEIYVLDSKKIAWNPVFSNIVMWPEYSSLRALTDKTRDYLIEFYKSFDNPIYNQTINFLNQSYLGNEVHNTFVKFIEDIDKTRKRPLLKIVPELAYELRYLS
jgi:sulfatase maturation enzyme AslB (radical SAM superfamily)